MGLSDSFPMADINGAGAVAPSGTASAAAVASSSSPLEPGDTDMAPMLFLSHCDHASNGAKAGEPEEFGTPVSTPLPLESVIKRSVSSTEGACVACHMLPHFGILPRTRLTPHHYSE
jgi:hypothetical protein